MKKIREFIAFLFIVSFFYSLFAPVQMTKYTLTDGDHTIVFQTMIHMAKEDFYKKVESDVQTYADNGYTFLYEGVRAGKINPNNNADIPTYDLSSFILGLTSQASGQYFSFAHSIPNSVNADVDTDWILDQFKKYNITIKKPTPVSKEELTSEVANIKAHRLLYSSIGVPLFRVSTRFSLIIEFYNELTNSHSTMDTIILVNRNRVLYNAFINCHCNKIYVNYGAAHFANFYDLLKKDNSNWHIVSEENYEAF